MNYRTFRSALVVGLICFVVGMAFGQGLYWESTTSTPIAGAKEIHSVSSYRPHMFKQSSDKESVIFRLDKGIIVRVDNDRKEYSEMTFAELEAQMKEASSGMEAQMAEMKKHLDEMPPEQRKMLEKVMGDKMNNAGGESKIGIAKTSDTKKISGFPCIKYAVTENGKDFGNVWTTTSVPDFGTMKDDFKEFGQRMMSMMPSKGSSIAIAMKKVDGFPIQTTIAGVTTTVTKVEKRSIAASEFAVPSGYTKVKFDLLEGQRHKPQPEQKANDEEQKDQ